MCRLYNLWFCVCVVFVMCGRVYVCLCVICVMCGCVYVEFFNGRVCVCVVF